MSNPYALLREPATAVRFRYAVRRCAPIRRRCYGVRRGSHVGDMQLGLVAPILRAHPHVEFLLGDGVWVVWLHGLGLPLTCQWRLADRADRADRVRCGHSITVEGLVWPAISPARLEPRRMQLARSGSAIG